MVPQQSHEAAMTSSEFGEKDENDSAQPIDDQENSTVFGSLQVKETSNTPYTDATQVFHRSFNINVLIIFIIEH